MLFSIKTLLIKPKIIDVERIDEPPKLNNGNAIPVNGMRPNTVNKFIIIWIDKIIIKPDNKYFSKSKSEVLIISETLKKNKNHKNRSIRLPKKPKFFAKSEKIKSVVWTGTNTS